MKNALFITGGVVLSAILWNMYQKSNGKTFTGKPLAAKADPAVVPGAKPIDTVLVEKTGVDGFDNIAGMPSMSMNRNRGFASAFPISRVKLTGTVTNTKEGCPQGSHSVKLPDGSYGCAVNTAV
jgi:hypothetical protein